MTTQTRPDHVRTTTSDLSWVDDLALPTGAGDATAASSRPGVHVEPLDRSRTSAAKKAYTTRFVADRLDGGAQVSLMSGEDVRPGLGDVLLARVCEIGQHKALQGPTGRRQILFQGDEVVVAYGDRYAPDQFEAHRPQQLTVTHLAAGGGLAADVVAQHGDMDDATLLEPLGLLTLDGEHPLNLRDVAPCAVRSTQAQPRTGPTTVVVLGSSMNAGKTTTAACLVRGLTASGRTVHAGKSTGTGAWGDPGLFLDAGAAAVRDFTDFGYPTTYRLDHTELRDLVTSVHAELSQGDPDVVVIEIADGIFQGETAHLVADPELGRTVDAVVFASGEALGAVAGVDRLRAHGLPVAAVSGALTASPLATREAAGALDLPVIDTYHLCEGSVADELLAQIRS